MSIMARCGSIALLLGAIAGATAMAHAASEPPGSWTDPPARGAAETGSDTARPADLKSADPKPSGARSGKPTEAATPPSQTTSTPRFAARPQAGASRRVAGPTRGTRLRVSARREREAAEPSAQPHRRIVRSTIERRTGSYAYASPYLGDEAPPRSVRRAGWGGLIGGGRAYRVAQARAAGFRVMRLRTYDFPDGSRVGRLTPYDPDDLD